MKFLTNREYRFFVKDCNPKIWYQCNSKDDHDKDDHDKYDLKKEDHNKENKKKQEKTREKKQHDHENFEKGKTINI